MIVYGNKPIDIKRNLPGELPCYILSVQPSVVRFFKLYNVHGVSESSQHLGKSDGGGRRDSSGSLPLSTTNAISSPTSVCDSRWQCMNQTPAKEQSES